MQSDRNLECLVAVDDLIKQSETKQIDLLWENYDTVDKSTIEALTKELEYLYELRDNGVVYEPLF